MKTILLIIFILVIGTFIYLKVQVSGDANSNFNKTTRYSLGKHRLLRTIFGLNNYGDARGDYLSETAPLVIEWFKPKTEETSFSAVLKDFADEVSTYTGRQVELAPGRDLDEGTVGLNTLSAYKLNSTLSAIGGGGSHLLVFFTTDYSPREQNELSTTFMESGMIISMNAHRDFLSGGVLNGYLLSSLLHEFGHQIGLEHNDDTNCIMSMHAGIDGRPLSFYGRFSPQDFCESEKEQINQLKAQYAN